MKIYIVEEFQDDCGCGSLELVAAYSSDEKAQKACERLASSPPTATTYRVVELEFNPPERAEGVR